MLGRAQKLYTVTKKLRERKTLDPIPDVKLFHRHALHRAIQCGVELLGTYLTRQKLCM